MDYKTSKQDIANRIKTIRLSNKHSQEKMAELIGVSYSTYVKIENSHQNITLQQLINVSKITNISTDFLLFGEINHDDCMNFDEYIKLVNFFEKDQIENLIKIFEIALKYREIK